MRQTELLDDYIKRLTEQSKKVPFVEAVDPDEQKRTDGFSQYRKTSLTWAKQMDEPFTCDTLEGDNIKEKAGDYLCIGGAKGEQWPVDKEVFESTYEKVK